MIRTAFYLFLFTLTAFFPGCKEEDGEPRRGKSTAMFNPDKEYGTVTDIDGNEYKTITIGAQTWMAENLRVTRYRNGNPIPNVKDPSAWGKLTSGAYCSYQNIQSVDTIATYGLLYNAYAATDARGIAPEGWHIPSDGEWYTLVKLLNGSDGALNEYSSSVAGGRMKETGTRHWMFPNRFADNSSGFTAISGGRLDSWGVAFRYFGYSAEYWTTTEYYTGFFYNWGMGTDFASAGRNGLPASCGIPIRCVKD